MAEETKDEKKEVGEGEEISVGKHQYYMDNTLKHILDACKKLVKRDWDMIFIVDGFEGIGKSILAQQLAYYVDPTFNLDRIVFQPNEFINAVKKAEKFQAIVYDEAFAGLSARTYFSQTNKALVSMLMQIRQKNLFIFIVCPTFFELDKYVAIWRSRGLFHLYAPKDNPFERGHFMFFSQNKKKLLWQMGKKLYSYAKPPSDFIGRFTNYYVVDEQEYRKKKLMAAEQRKLEPVEKSTYQRNALIYYLYEHGLTHREIAEIIKKYSRFGLTREAITLIINQMKEKLEEEENLSK